MMLTDAAITDALSQTVEKIRVGDLEQAQAGLEVLEFHRLMRPMKDSGKGPRRFFDPTLSPVGGTSGVSSSRYD